MRMTKKVTALAMTAVLTAASLAGCGGNNSSNNNSTTAANAGTTPAATTAAANTGTGSGARPSR